MNLRPYRVVGCVAKGPETVDHGPTDQRVVAFTFDDGPWKQTAAILNVLEQKRAVATFFQVGDRVARYAALDRRMLRDGDMIGDHSWDHSNLKGKREECKCQIKKALVAIRAATGFTPCLWRPPYGAVDKDEEDDAREVGFTTVGWSDTPQDWHQPGVQQIIHLTVSQADPGAIILHHDGTEPRNTEWWNNNRRETLAALPHEIDMLRSEGYRFVTVTQLLGYRLKYKK
jgi:peptidoglycan/xylan/chitin deacetylase (PgdA/CDA1 family)